VEQLVNVAQAALMQTVRCNGACHATETSSKHKSYLPWFVNI